MSIDCISCQIKRDSKLKLVSSLKAKTIAILCPTAKLSSIGLLKTGLTKKVAFKASLSVDSSIDAKENMSFGLHALEPLPNANIRGSLAVSGNIISRVSCSSNFSNIYTDKFAGSISQINSIDNFQATEKLYPIKDIVTELDGKLFVDNNLSTEDLYSNIDEGIFTGNYTQNFKISKRISDEVSSYIQPSSIVTDGNFRYKFEVTTPTQVAKESFLFIRASAPTKNYISHIPPKYTLSNIRFEDPSGNLIIKYKDIVLMGDSDYDLENINYTTYVSEPEVNNLLLHTWENDYPLMEEGSGYTLNIDINVSCLDDPFNTGFNLGYEYGCEASGNVLSLPENIPLLPTNNLRISSIEISNSGGVGILRDNYLNFYSEVSPIGQRISRSIYPVKILTNDFDSTIFPSVSSTWKSSNAPIYNTSPSGANQLNNILINGSTSDYITLDYINGIADSGKLNLKFSHAKPRKVIQYTDGAFSFGSDENGFDSASLSNVAAIDNFFTIDSISLKVRAKKSASSRDYILDIVGYSDDKLLNITSAVGGFLQNISGVGSLPSSSGFSNSSELSISAKPLSDKDAYYESSLTNNDGGDHYQLATLPVVNSTTFADYIIPLKIYEDRVAIGKSKDYSMSSSFENLYLDIYPIPSGASIANVELIVYYKPSNALMLHTLGQASRELDSRTVKIYPSSRKNNDSIVNTGPQLAPISLIQNIPHAYTTPSTLKTNYSRRWRGVEGNVVSGPFNPYQFDFSFYNPQLNTPFLNGYFSFNNDNNGSIISDQIPELSPVSGTYVGSYNVVKNIGLRFNSSSLFSSPTLYKTIDWTSISGYQNNNLHGLIADAYDNAVRVSGSNGYIDFGNIDTSSGFSIFARFSPDINMSGAGYNLWNSGIIFAKHDSGKNLEFSLGYENGHLTGYARASNGSVKKVQDNLHYYEYQYPISVVLTYNDNLSNKLKLYTDNEKSSTNTFHHLRDQSSSFTLASGNSSLTFGYSHGDNIGTNIFITDIGISTYNENGTNLIDSNAGQVNLLYKEMQVEHFFETIKQKFWNPSESYDKDEFKLWQYIDDDTSAWKLGAFKTCSFSPAYDSFTTRIGADYLVHRLKHSGSGYSSITNLTLPSSVPTSGVCYHTQIENDFLRFNLIDIPDAEPNFVSVPPRICKTLPRGYDFAERAMVVDTIIQYETHDDISWSTGEVGPKLIVSLYTKNQEPVDRPSKVNWGLINRHTHYLKPSGCWTKLSSTFDFNDLLDTSEPWANFDQERNTSELDTKYYSTDINDMFLQYDLVYPSGSPFDCTIKIHSANVRLENAIVQSADSTDQLSLAISGEYKSLSDLSLYSYGLDNTNESLNIFVISDVVPTASSIMSMMCSGATLSTNSLELYTLNTGSINNSGMPIYVDGRFNQFDEQNLSLFTKNLLSSQTSSGNVALFTNNKISSGLSSDYINIYINANTAGEDHIPQISMSLYTQLLEYVDNYSNNFNLYVAAQDYTVTKLENQFNLYTLNYLAYNQDLNEQTTISWNSDNVGKNISVDDNKYSSLSANDEIRGVDLMCYGNCYAPNPCQEQSVVQHEKLWIAPTECVDGGIFRAKNTYTNLATSGFNTPVGYSGHFYGIRKYSDLVPNAPYKVVLAGRTGNTNYIPVPSEFEELNYYLEGFGQSGVKLADDNNRQVGNKYGTSVSVKNDLIAIGSPFSNIIDPEGYELNNAGTVFLYRRLPAPSGNDWSLDISDHKSSWILEEQINLPSGYIRDYYTTQSRVLADGFDPIVERYWNVGQEGRQFGHSLDLAITSGTNSLHENNKEILVVGGPSSEWTRTFENATPSSIPICLMIFTDEFQPIVRKNNESIYLSYNDVLNSIKDKDILFKYLSNPSTSFDVKLIILEPTLDDERPSYDFADPKPTFITKKRIHRRRGSDLQTEKILSGIKEAFHETFPYDTNIVDNNIPPILGFYVDNSVSLGKASLNGNGGGAIDQFISYYANYSFESGVHDFYGNQVSGSVVEFIPSFEDSENWVKMSQDVLNYTLDTGRLVLENQVKYFTSGVGSNYYNENLGEFNHIPSSGGKVYIFEKESGSWNLIQQIDSPITAYGTPDRFGHAVAISDNTEVIAIGSPYIDNACEIYEYKNNEKLRLYNELGSWINLKSSQNYGIGRYAQLKAEYLSNIDNIGLLEAGKTLYLSLNSIEKFDARRYLNINEYQNIKSFKYSDLSIIGTWDFLTYKFVPTPRLGYSAAVNEDGSIVAFGSPTDSLNQWDDGNVWYKNEGYYEPLNIDNINGEILPSWRSNTNAGSVRLFESRRYYPHNTVVEFTKFGNLQESISDSGDYLNFTYLSGIFQDKNFYKTEFTELDIPEQAGLAFIITPEIDAASDEIIEKIVKWLSLGDRNLVLVGNDPIWEASGIYSTSNDIINKILSKLNSRMRLHPARNAYEALTSGCDFNIMPSFTPEYSTPSYIQPTIMRGNGVADIKMHFPNYYQVSSCQKTQELGGTLNAKCEMPLIHNGDLRAQWYDECYPCFGELPVRYPVNWPMVFKNFNLPCCNQNSSPVPRYNLNNFEPVPLLAAAEYSEPKTVIYPAVPERYSPIPVYQNITYPTQRYDFDNDSVGNDIEFVWTNDIGNYSYLNTNIGNTDSTGKFYNPEQFDDRDSILQAIAVSREDLITSKIKIDDYSTYCAQQNYQNTSSKVILIAGVKTESAQELYYSAGDRNINFYANIAFNTANLNSNISQLGGWTQKTNFTDGYESSFLYSLFLNLGHDVTLNADRPYTFNDICWIANTNNLPNSQELSYIVDWLASGNKKLVITYDFSQSQARIISQLCSMLGLSISPLFLSGNNAYAESTSRSLTFNTASNISIGNNSSITKYDLSDTLSFIPIKTVNNNQVVCYESKSVINTETNLRGYWQMKSGLCKVSFPVVAGSGYKLFIDTVSETPNETEPLRAYICNASNYINQPIGLSAIRDLDYDTDQVVDIEPAYIGYIKEFLQTSPGFVNTYSLDVQAFSTASEITIYFEGNNVRCNNQNKTYAPSTVRLLSVSGVSLPIKTIYGTETINTIVGFENVKVADAIPETTVILPAELKQISTDNTKYCSSNLCIQNGMGGKQIADGPVVAAQEVESITVFDAGYERSRITVLSDSSLVQGSCLLNEEGRIPENTINFIRSLYPPTVFTNSNNGRQFNTMTKIVGPERGSPQKYYALSGNSGINLLFNTQSPSQASLSSFDNNDSKYDPRYVIRTSKPYSDDMLPSEIERIKNEKIAEFVQSQNDYGATARFSGIIEGKLYQDASFKGGMPELMKDTGYDYLDFERFPSGYRGDLFGFSIDLYKNKLIVGSPFSAFSNNEIKSWNYVSNNISSGVQIGYDGGAGSVYIFEKTYNGSGLQGSKTPWEFTNKLRPESINIASGNDITGDRFGYDVSIDGDIIAVGAPGHDFGNYIIINSGAFGHKFFNKDFNNLTRESHDLGLDTVRSEFNSSGYMTNNGAVFTFENRIIDWPTKTKKWIYIEKSVPEQDYQFSDSGVNLVYLLSSIYDYPISGNMILPDFNNEVASNNPDNLNTLNTQMYFNAIDLNEIDASEYFDDAIVNGGTISISQNGNLAAYTFVSGEMLKSGNVYFIDPTNNLNQIIFANSFFNFDEPVNVYLGSISISSNNFYGTSVDINKASRTDSDYTIVAGSPMNRYSSSGTDMINSAGSSYITDIMLREQPASNQNPESFINARVFGEIYPSGQYSINLNFANNYDNNKLYSSSGVIYSNENGDIFLEVSGQDPSIKGFIQHRPYILSVDGQYLYGIPTNDGLRLSIFGKVNVDNNMNMYTNVDNNAFVYNNMGLYTGSITDFASGIPSGLYLFTECPDPTEISNSGLILFASGIGSNTDTLNLRIRGK